MVTSAEIEAEVAGQTVATRFRDTVRSHPDRVALRWKDGDAWRELTWAEYADRACRVAAALEALGVVRGERVVLMMRNRHEFHIADIAVLLLRRDPGVDLQLLRARAGAVPRVAIAVRSSRSSRTSTTSNAS